MRTKPYKTAILARYAARVPLEDRTLREIFNAASSTNPHLSRAAMAFNWTDVHYWYYLQIIRIRTKREEIYPSLRLTPQNMKRYRTKGPR